MYTIFHRSSRRLSSLGLALTLMLLIVTGCSKSNVDDSLQLLSTVPADAGMVSVINLDVLVRQSGGNVSDGSLQQADALNSMAAQYLKGHDLEVAKWLLSPGSGVECSSAVLFYYKNRPYLYALIADESALRAGIDRLWPGEWQTSGKTSHKEQVAIRDGRVLLLPDFDASLAETFANLSEPSSFRSNPYAETLAKSTDALSLWSTLDALWTDSGLSFSDLTLARMAMNMAFKNPKYLTASANISEGGLSTSVNVLDTDLRPARCELALSRLDTKLISAFGGNANCVIAIAVSQKLVKQLVQLGSSFGGQLPPAFSSAIESLDGTVAIASSAEIDRIKNESDRLPGFKCAIQTNGKNNAALLQTLEAIMGKAEINGNTFTFGNDAYGNGIAPVAEVAKTFDGAWLGLATMMPMADGKGKGCLYITLLPADNSLRMNLKFVIK